jgi:hypothetical protein
MTLEEMITKYMALRDKRNAIKKSITDKVKEYDDAMEALAGMLKHHMQANNLQSIATTAGTAFFKRVTSATVADKSLFREYVIANGDFDMADFRPSKEAVEAYIEENKGNLPPGINFSVMQEVGVQKI